MDRKTQIDTFSSFSQVSRETITSLSKYEKMLIKANNNLNLIGKSTIKEIWTRHFLDCFQVIDFIDKNDKNIVDFGSGAGFPGLIVAIGLKDRNIFANIKLIEKSPKKTKFLQEVIKVLDLKVAVSNENILESKNFFTEEVFVARAFKPLEKILELIHNKVKNLNKFFIFLGKTGHSELIEASKSWDIQYKQRVSVTSDDSIIIEINNLKKK